ncbi:MAG: squalene/phytoene synthase family protein [Nitrospirae bacterium]|nr:squalene/phytoene synthase family protein [Nitrospirota bacterium]
MLPRDQRTALSAVYEFCRVVDDAVDLANDFDEARRALLEWRRELDRIYEDRPTHPVGIRLAPVVSAYRLPRVHFDELLLGVAMDIGRPRYESFAELSRYTYRVASTVGLLCLPIFGCEGKAAEAYAIERGLSLQLTNIIRDVKADAARDRIYLPREDFEAFGYTEEELLANAHTPAFERLMALECRRARESHARAKALLPDSQRLLAPEIMGRTYEALLDRIEASGYRLFDRPITLPTTTKAAIAVKSWLGARGANRRPA